MKRKREQRGPAPKRTQNLLNPSPRHYECPEREAFIYIAEEHNEIRVLLDSGSNIFLLNCYNRGLVLVILAAGNLSIVNEHFSLVL